MSIEIRATYRVQVNPEFPLTEAARRVRYLEKLGVSHLYTSPYLQASPGSQHGYDVANPGKVNSELGGEPAHETLTKELNQFKLGLVVDIVPNHMAITAENPWWWDVLQNGPSSRYASYFDVDWDPPEARHSNKVLVPILGDHYGRVLENGELQVFYENGEFFVRYYDNRYPVNPRSVSTLIGTAAAWSHSERLAFIAGALEDLPSSQATDRISAARRYRDTGVLLNLFEKVLDAEPATRASLEQALERLNQDPDALDAFLEAQNYRLAYWRMAARELGYRRFFDINGLIGLRVEDESVFLDTHRLILQWIREGTVDGLRIDHPDGLFDPQGYLERLNRAAPEAWIVVEKVLEPGEALPQTWPVAGTTGYDFLNRLNGIFVDPSSEERLTAFYQTFTGLDTEYETQVREKKLHAAFETLGSDLNRLTFLMVLIGEKHRRYRDYTRDEIRTALAEMAACFPVYRSYVRPSQGQVSAQDERVILTAAAAAKKNQPEIDEELFDFIVSLLLLRTTGELENEFVSRFQQFSGPVMAKGVEDTIFYTYNRFISLNEVGGDPGSFGVQLHQFHQENADNQANWPRTMLTTSTHDTKRSEDVRARLNVISEIPEAWISAVESWASHNEKYRHQGMPDRNDEYLYYQTLVGAWSLSPERAGEYMQKALREAKRHTSWRSPEASYEAAMQAFVRGTLADRPFVQMVEKFVARVLPGGQINSLAQALIKLTAPGIPDIYQGSELWDLSLVDPDNRRPVDYETRAQFLDALRKGLPVENILARGMEGLPKLWVTYKTLQLRKQHPDWFGTEADYQPLESSGEHAVAFRRGENVVIVTARWLTRPGKRWESETIHIPAGTWKKQFSEEQVQGGEITLGELLKHFPVCLLTRVMDGMDE